MPDEFEGPPRVPGWEPMVYRMQGTAGVLRVEEGRDGRRAGGRSLRTDATRRVG